jgi:hypothetical protein
MQLPLAQPGNHGYPGSVELAGRCRRTSPFDPVGLLDQADADSLQQRRLTGRHQIRRVHPAARTMTKKQPGTRPIRSVQMDTRRPRRRLHFERSHPRDADSNDQRAAPCRSTHRCVSGIG